MVVIWPKEAASLTQLIHKAALAVITSPPLRLPTSPAHLQAPLLPIWGCLSPSWVTLVMCWIDPCSAQARGRELPPRADPDPRVGKALQVEKRTTEQLLGPGARMGSSLTEACLISHSSKKLASHNFPPPVQPVQPFLSRCDHPSEDPLPQPKPSVLGKTQGWH